MENLKEKRICECVLFSLSSDWISKQCDEAILRKVIFQWCICEVAASSIMALNSLQHSLSLAPSNSNRTTTMPFHIVVAIIHKCLSHFYSPRCLCTAQLFNRKSSVRCAELCVSLCRSLKLLSLIKLICFFHLRFQRALFSSVWVRNTRFIGEYFYLLSRTFFFARRNNKNINVMFDECVIKRWKIHSSDSITHPNAHNTQSHDRP